MSCSGPCTPPWLSGTDLEWILKAGLMNRDQLLGVLRTRKTLLARRYDVTDSLSKILSRANRVLTPAMSTYWSGLSAHVQTDCP